VRTLFDAAGVHVTDEFVVAGGRRYPIGEIDRVWAARPRGRRAPTWLVVVAAGGALAALAGVVALALKSWLVVALGLPALALFILFGGPMDLLTHWIENRPWELRISSRGRVAALLRDNSVEVNKGVRAILRAREIYDDRAR
jgi:hypothetical protein